MPSQRDQEVLPQVAVCVDKSRKYGRKVLQGIADYAETVGRWSLIVDSMATGSYSADWLKDWKGDGILAYVESRATAKRLRIRHPGGRGLRPPAGPQAAPSRE
jgi:LacI family transcriptional regulator